jgi:condensin complex subunit 3
VASVSIALRATAVRRGLADRAPTVRAAAVDMLHRWLEAFEGDALALLGALDAESHEDVAASVVKELIATGKIKPMEVAASVPEGNPPGGGLRRNLSSSSQLMSPEAAVYWRVLCEELSAAAGEHGSHAATAMGQRQVVSAAVAREKLEALEAALPAAASDLLALLAAHADAGSKFVARQLLPLLKLIDMADATARKGTAQLVDAQLRAAPTAAADVDADVAGAVSSYACGGDGEWERALVTVARAVHSSTADAAAAVLAAADALRDDVNTVGLVSC